MESTASQMEKTATLHGPFGEVIRAAPWLRSIRSGSQPSIRMMKQTCSTTGIGTLSTIVKELSTDGHRHQGQRVVGSAAVVVAKLASYTEHYINFMKMMAAKHWYLAFGVWLLSLCPGYCFFNPEFCNYEPAFADASSGKVASQLACPSGYEPELQLRAIAKAN